MSFSKIFQVFIVVRASTVHAEVMFASIRKLTIRLALSVVITGLSGVLIFGLSTPSHAQGKADCVGKECANIGGKVGDAPTTREIRYTIWNDSARTVKFRLPTGRTYRLRPDERGHYKNSSKDGNFKMYVFNTELTYKLESGDHKFRWNKEKGRIWFVKNYR